jgi:TonB family protein
MFQPAIDRHLFGLQRVFYATIARLLSIWVLAIVAFAAAPLCAQARAPIHKVPPNYPPIAKQMHITGTVVVIVTVDATGKVIKAESTSGNKLLATSAIDAVKQWKFAPGDANDTFPVSVDFGMDVN